jgi:hypothetical protein
VRGGSIDFNSCNIYSNTARGVSTRHPSTTHWSKDPMDFTLLTMVVSCHVCAGREHTQPKRHPPFWSMDPMDL